ncbi:MULTISPECIES: hypothetical protein [unclassified Methanobrevibacter]|uniref:hypothetical protein n=1 Tax=unclassified Methanobrevibacter TaxID=2638681 RepID=UPI0027368BE6|nr:MULTISPECIES: hypothetical protein [unclassified Methanobrevibacter]
MDLIGGYLLILLVLFTANIALILGNYEFNSSKSILMSLIFSVITFALMYLSNYLNAGLSFILDYLGLIFLIIAIVISASMIHYSKTDDFKPALYSIATIFLISAVLFASQTNLDFLNTALYSIFSFIIIFIVYQLTKLLHHAKRQYPVIIGEYMSLFAVLMFIFALTYNSTRNLDYTMFRSFLILTPTYQLIYVIIGIVVVLVIGVLINDTKGGNS